MDLTSLTLFNQMQHKMAWLSARQNVLSQNVANADTPNYASRDLKPFGFANHLELGQPLPMAQSTGMHLTGTLGGSLNPIVSKDNIAIETNPAGNKVSLEDQLTKVGQTGMEYQMMTNLYRKQVSMLKTAMGKNGTN